MRIFRSSFNPLPLIAVITLAAALAGAPAAQQPPAGPPPEGQGRGFGGPGRGGRGTPIKPGEECPPGTTEIRPDRCQTPELPAPRIVDYRPHTTLVTPGHPVPKAKFPVVDFHGHPRGLIDSAEGLTSSCAALDRLNVRVMVGADNVSGDRLARALDAIVTPAPGPRARAHGHQLQERRTGLGGEGRRAARSRSSRPAPSASARSAKGSACPRARRTARASSSTTRRSIRSGRRARVSISRCSSTRPIRGVLPADRLPQRALARAGAVPRSALSGQRVSALRSAHGGAGRLFTKHPKTTFVAAHMGWHANDLGAARQDAGRRCPTVHRGRRGALRHRPPAARGARLLREVPGPGAVREGLVPARGVSVLLARVRDARRLLRLLPRTITPSGSCTASICRMPC